MSSRKSATGKSHPTTKLCGTRADQGALLKRALQWIVIDSMFSEFKQHGNSSWKASSMIILAVLTAWIPSQQLTESFSKATVLSKKLFDVLAIQTYQGMMRALVTNGSNLLSIVCSRIQVLMSEVSPEHFRIGGWVPLAVDGSRFTTPRTQSNENAFSAKHYGRGTHAKSRRKWKNKSRRSRKIIPIKPQIWLTLIWHMGLKLSWCWKKGASTSSERHHFMEMLHTIKFPVKTLFCGDAGFVGYELWSTVIEQGHSFLMRVGGNVRLLKKLATVRQGDGIVFLWPDKVAQKKQPPLVLRLIQITTTAGTMYLVTNVLEERRLSVHAIGKLYPLRWGIELQFRSTKQTFGLGNLRSRNADHAMVELDWSLVALTMIQLLAIREQTKIDIPPERSSVSEAIKAIRSAIDSWRETQCNSTNLRAKLRTATKDEYHRTSSRKARYQPSSKEKPSATKPILVDATAKQRSRYQTLLNAA